MCLCYKHPTGSCDVAQVILQHSEPGSAFQVLGCATTHVCPTYPGDNHPLITVAGSSPHAMHLTSPSCGRCICSTVCSLYRRPPHFPITLTTLSLPARCVLSSALCALCPVMPFSMRAQAWPVRTVVTPEEAAYHSQETG